MELDYTNLQFTQEGVEANSPKRVLQEALALGWVMNEADWLQILNDRNLTSHTLSIAFERKSFGIWSVKVQCNS